MKGTGDRLTQLVYFFLVFFFLLFLAWPLQMENRESIG